MENIEDRGQEICMRMDAGFGVVCVRVGAIPVCAGLNVENGIGLCRSWEGTGETSMLLNQAEGLCVRSLSDTGR